MSVHKKLYINDVLYTPSVADFPFSDSTWGNLSTVNQDLARDDTPQFSGVKFGGSSGVTITYEGDNNYELKLPLVVPSDGQSLKQGSGGLEWVDYSGFNQSLNTTNDVKFNSLVAVGAVSATSLSASNGLSISGGSVDIVSGNLALGTGSFSLETGDLNMGTGDLTLGSGDLKVSAGSSEFKAASATSLSVSGATTLGALGATNLALSGTLAVDGQSTLGLVETKHLDVKSGGLTVTAGGLTVTDGGLAVNAGGLTVTAGGLTVTDGGLTVSAGGLAVSSGDLFAATGVESKLKNTTITGAFGVTGLSTLTGLVTVASGGLSVTEGGLTVVSGATSLKSTSVDGVLSVMGSAFVSSTLGAGATILDSLTVSGASSLHSVTASSGVTLSGGNLAVQSGTLSVSGASTLSSTLNVVGVSTLANTTINGDLVVTGTTTTINSTDVDIKDKIITLNKGETEAGVAGLLPVGLEVDRGSLDKSGLLYQESSTIPFWKVGMLGSYHRLLEAANDIASADLGKIPLFDVDGRLSASTGISANTATQLKNMGGSTSVSSAQWAYLGNFNQDLTQTSDVSFNSLNVVDLTATGNINLGAGSSVSVSVSSAVTASSVISHGITVVQTVGSTVTLTLPDNLGAKGRTYLVYFKSKTASFQVDVLPAGSDVIEGSPSFGLNQAGQHTKFTSIGDGTWLVA